MTTALQYAELCAASYDPNAVWDQEWLYREVRFCLKRIEGLSIIVFRGSESPEDWLRDAEGWPQWDSMLGFVHAGFLHAAGEIYKILNPLVGPRVAFTGHSLGGAEARVQAALFTVMGTPVEEVHVFGSPKPAFENLSRIIQKSGMRHVSWRNRNDPVPMVPMVLPAWTHPEEWGVLSEAPSTDDFSPLRDHHIGLYVRGLGETKEQTPAQQ